MAGKRILLATEFIRGSGTLDRLLPLAVALADRGHDVTLALPPKLSGAAEATGFPLLPAPVWDVPPPPGFLAVSYADLLLLGGYAAPDALLGLLRGWGALLDQAAPDLLVADFAPTAMLAARLRGLAMAAVGDGYSLPPPTRPMTVMRPWAEIPPGASADVEGRVMAVIGACTAPLQGPPLRHLRDLFSGVPSFLCTFRETDHYGGRGDDAAYYGEVFPPSRGPVPQWPATGGERVYVDLDPRHPALPPLIAVLDRLGLPSLIQGRGLPPDVAAQIAKPSVHVIATGNRNALLSGCNLVVCQDAGVAVPGLLAGKPLLMLPVFVEQMMTLHRVATQGMGYGLPPDSDEEAIDAALRRLADDRETRLRAANFARLYDGYRSGLAIDAVADEVDDLLG